MHCHYKCNKTSLTSVSVEVKENNDLLKRIMYKIKIFFISSFKWKTISNSCTHLMRPHQGHTGHSHISSCSTWRSSRTVQPRCRSPLCWSSDVPRGTRRHISPLLWRRHTSLPGRHCKSKRDSRLSSRGRCRGGECGASLGDSDY